MEFLPFDPARARGSEHAAESDRAVDEQTASDAWAGGVPGKLVADVLTVSDVADMVNRALVSGLPARLRVVGEVSNLSTRQHWFFSLKDENAVLKCVVWKSRAERFGFVPANGTEVVASGSIQHYGPQGQTQMYVEALEPVGAGALELKFKALCAELRGLGYFDPDRKRTLPSFPRAVAVVTSAGGAALQDVLDTMRRRCPAVRVVAVDVLVQGQAAASSIVAGLRRVLSARDRLGIDVVILTRGGGSIEDLWAFNERPVADELVNYPIPVVAAIGHETDTTIAELVADMRCATPTQAAMMVTPDRGELSGLLRHMHHRLSLLMSQAQRMRLQRYATVSARYAATGSLFVQTRAKVERMEDGLKHAMAMLIRRRSDAVHHLSQALQHAVPQQALSRRERNLAILGSRLNWLIQSAMELGRRAVRDTGQRLETGMAHVEREKRLMLRSRMARLEAVNPGSVLQRGYSITRLAGEDGAGSVVRDVSQVLPGTDVITEVRQGRFRSRVVDVGGSQPRGSAAATSDRKRGEGVGSARTSQSPGLFEQ